MLDVETNMAFDLNSAWGTEMKVVICERCNWRYLLPRQKQDALPLCPHCFQAQLVAAEGSASDQPYPYPPELVAPFGVTQQALEESVRQFASGIPYAPPDLNYTVMHTRLAPVFLPMWLVDGEVNANWQAETGYNYDVVSHQEYYDDGNRKWQTREVREPRIRWEPRMGKLTRTYQNISAPALDEVTRLKRQVGDFRLDRLQPYQPSHLKHAYVRLPDRTPEDAWSEAAPSFQNQAAEECKQACAADHVRQFRWSARFDHLNWTLMLLPFYTTYYLDDEQQPQTVLIYGQNGVITGSRRSSMQRARRTSSIILAIGLTVFLLGLVLGVLSVPMPALAPLAAIALLIGIPGTLAAFIPIGIVWDFNRRQAQNAQQGPIQS